MKIPVLNNHDHTQPIGELSAEEGKLVLSVPQGISREDIFEMFGGAGMRVLEMSQVDGVILIQKAEFLEFSLCPSPVATESAAGARWHEEDKEIPIGGKPSETP